MSNSSPLNNNPQLSGDPGRSQSSPAKKNPRQLASTLLLVILIGVLAVIVVTRWDNIVNAFHQPKEAAEGGRKEFPEPKGDPAVEKAAFEELNKRNLLVIAEKIGEGSEKRVTNVSFCDKTTCKPVAIDDEMLKETAKLYRLNSINASKCKITDEQLKYLSGLTSLVSLVLTETPITDAGLEHLRTLNRLESFLLPNTDITDEGLDSIAAMTNLKDLDLSQTKVTDEGMKKLEPLTELNWLLLQKTKITDAGSGNFGAL